MLQALHSRSTGGVAAHLEVLRSRGAERFMATYYVGYGHKSIGDCGSATVFVEGVSMLCAKAIQDWPLYSGQESSTRYIDFAAQPHIDPVGTEASASILAAWRTFYVEGLRELVPVLKQRFPRAETEKETVYDKAIDARAFDTMRAFLPAGAATNVAWTMNLRQFADSILYLRHHPLAEVRAVAAATHQALLAAFPSSFSDATYEATEAYTDTCMQQYYFDDPDPVTFELFYDGIDRGLLGEYSETMRTRPNGKTELPHRMGECGMVGFRFLLDFGSFRDVQRHRAVKQRMPLLSTRHGFHSWYLDELPETLRTRATALVEQQIRAIEEVTTDPYMRQYYVAMGFLGTNRLVGTLPALTYLVELRSSRFVHPTLRERARQMAGALLATYSDLGLVLHLPLDPDRFDVKRGEHDITRT